MDVQDVTEVRQGAEDLLSALARLDLDAMVPTAHRELVTVCDRVERAVRTAKSMAAAKVAETAVWQGEGDRSAEDWLARTTATSRAEAAKELQCGRDLQLVPEVAKVATAGELSAKQTEAVAGAAAVNPSATGRLLRSAKDKGLRELQDECRATRTNAAKRFCHTDHALKTAGWLVSEPDAEGQCTFTPPRGAGQRPPVGATVVDELADSIQAALRARRGALARS